MQKRSEFEKYQTAKVPTVHPPPVVTQLPGVETPSNYSVTCEQPTGNSGVYPAQVIQPPAPGQNQAVHSGQYGHPPDPQITQGYPNNLESVLATEDKLSFHSIRPIGFGTGMPIVQIRGSDNQLIMSSLLTQNAVMIDTHSRGYRHTGAISHPILSFNDPAGKNIITCKQNYRDQTVSAEDRLLGIIRGEHMSACSCKRVKLYAENSHGELYFETLHQNSEFTFVRDGTTIIATARKGIINGVGFGIEFAPNLDATTKAVIIVGTYDLYIMYHAVTVCGFSGTLSLNRWRLLTPLLCCCCCMS
ncbi:unnamed protein product [Allacma fusca]|uniref:Uncharacterized protein n=1 Tax=Allacma fusca TaxID=39272 RepID=A0A8J2NW52_9HEXA|nr:unnamed protein product [Allacma fusca]